LTGQKVWARGQHSHIAYMVGFGHDSRTLVSGADDSLCYLWDLRPAKAHPQREDLPKVWDDLAADDSVVVCKAMWALLDSTDRAVDLIAEKLGSVRTLVETEQLSEGISIEEHQRRKRLKKALAAKDPKIELTIVARRAVSLLEQIGTPAAVRLLDDLAKRNAESDLGRLAASALNRHRIRTP
jgi:hypothetical protein